MNLDGFELFRFVGDEDCGVGLECRDCSEGGLPQVYLRPDPGDRTYRDRPDVVVVDSGVDLLMAARAHLDTHHGGE